MFKTAHNMMKLKVKITPQTPLLVASGKTFDVTHPDIEFIRVNTKEGETVYVPGSSIKGVLRAGLEAILGENETLSDKICSTSEKMCHDLHKEDDKTKKVPYRLHCPVCRMFGSGDLASRLEISDIFPFDLEDSPEKKKEQIEAIQKMITTRTGIQIDRKTGKTKGGALFNYEILGGGELFGEFTFTNYELYQPGLLFTLFGLSNEGFLRYGHSKSRGLGVLNFTVESMKILQLGQLKGSTIKGVGIIETYSDYDFYMKGNDKIDKAFDDYHEDNILYSTLAFADRQVIDEVTALFKSKINTFLEQGGKEV
jgi:CRISPR-associated RAMP protein (TIGR02581 family)